MELNKIPEPLNAQERLLYAMVVRQNIMIEQMSSIIEHISKKDGVAVEETKVVEEVVKPTRKRTTKAKG
jgi:DNA-binding MltR family transcriptional regulator